MNTHLAPTLAVAIHDAHALRPEIMQRMALTDAQRFRAEEPLTGRLTEFCLERMVAESSRFEFDLDRPRDQAVYSDVEECEGVKIWKADLPKDVVQRSRRKYDEFYRDLEQRLESLSVDHEQVLLFDLHSYNHRHSGPDGPVDNPYLNPEIHLRTDSLNRRHWKRVVEMFLQEMRRFNFLSWRLDVRENVRPEPEDQDSGYLAEWIHQKFPDTVCCLSVEIKKFFMNEWIGIADEQQVQALQRAFAFTLPGIQRALHQTGANHSSLR